MVEKPFWLIFVLQAVGLAGSGDSGGNIGDLRGAKGVTGDLKFNGKIGLFACAGV